MKKTLLLFAIALMGATTLNAQKTWNISDFPAMSLSADTIINGLQIMASSSKGITIDANNKTNGSLSFTQRLKLGGSAATDSVTPFLPTARALAFKVTGACTISVAALSSSSSSDRMLYLTDGTDTLTTISAPGSYTDAAGDNVPLNTYAYTGGAATLYLYSPSSGVNVYYLDVPTGVDFTTTAVNNPTYSININSLVYYNGNEIVNKESRTIEVFNILGNLVAKSNQNISTDSFAKGIYMVKAEGVESTLKFIK